MSLSGKPTAPACNAAKTYWSRSQDHDLGVWQQIADHPTWSDRDSLVRVVDVIAVVVPAHEDRPAAAVWASPLLVTCVVMAMSAINVAVFGYALGGGGRGCACPP
ncbi:MAG TPA: hypothetical protein VFI46_07360 [Jiangellaceae bacterium]|nr:hypothetical protein [Jiangellaceae bacterium]